MEQIEIDSSLLWRFRFNACDRCHDGWDRGLWYDKKEKRFFQTCETKSTNYNFSNPNDIIQLIFVSGNNNSDGLVECCESCCGCTETFMTEHKINMKIWEFNDYMDELYWADDKSNPYNIDEEEIEKYHEDKSCSWYDVDTLYDTCLSDKFEEWYPIEPINWGTDEIEKDIEFIEV